MLPIDNSKFSNVVMASASASAKDAIVKDNYFDQNSLNAVKAMGRKNDPQALKEIAKKFEAMFVQQMLKSMRDANEVFADGDMLSSGDVKFHQEMLDQQMVLNLTSGKGIGLATSMYQQMQAMHGKNDTAASEESEAPILPLLRAPTLTKPVSSNSSGLEPPALIARASIRPVGSKNAIVQTPEDFIAVVKPYAEKAATELNISVDVLLAQAALETGWGKHVIHDKQGNNSFNIFNIKKGSSWDGKSVGVQSLEYRQGTAQKEHSQFRQYENYLQSFSDYVSLMKTNPRYREALDAGTDSANYAKALQSAGYATDPNYADKITNLLTSEPIRAAKNLTAVEAGLTGNSVTPSLAPIDKG